MIYEQHEHYDTSVLSFKEKEDLLRKAFDKKFNWWVDKLDCRVSFAREKTDMSFEEVMTHFSDKACMVVIHRKKGFLDDAPHLEVGFCTMESPIEYFLWIEVPISLKEEFVKNLKKL